MIPESVANFRAACRAKIPRYYSGLAHFCFTSSLSLTVIVYVLWLARSATLFELITIPIAFLYANGVEYLIHRNPMHHPMKFVSIMFERHSLIHHRFFTDTAMSFEEQKDYQLVLFPPAMFLGFLAGALPPAILLGFLISKTAGLLFIAVGMAYYLTYEWLHFSFHVDENTFIGRLAVVKRLRRHHTIHHNPKFMNRYNFNITFPICDYLFRTYYRDRLNEAMAKDSM